MTESVMTEKLSVLTKLQGVYDYFDGPEGLQNVEVVASPAFALELTGSRNGGVWDSGWYGKIPVVAEGPDGRIASLRRRDTT